MLTENRDQRAFQRMELNSTVFLESDTESVEGLCRNISATGALIEIASGLCQLGEEWQLVMPAADENVEPLKAIAKVLRVDAGTTTDVIALSLSAVR